MAAGLTGPCENAMENQPRFPMFFPQGPAAWSGFCLSTSGPPLVLPGFHPVQHVRFKPADSSLGQLDTLRELPGHFQPADRGRRKARDLLDGRLSDKTRLHHTCSFCTVVVRHGQTMLCPSTWAARPKPWAKPWANAV